MVWVWMRHLRDGRNLSPLRAFAAASAASMAIFVAVFAVLSGLAGVGLGWLTALAGSVKIINWLTVPTAVANLINAIGGLFFPVNFYAVLEVDPHRRHRRSSRSHFRCCGGGFGTPTVRR